jgi:hypothetical protein
VANLSRLLVEGGPDRDALRDAAARAKAAIDDQLCPSAN